jgi:hypothetical protein
VGGIIFGGKKSYIIEVLWTLDGLGVILVHLEVDKMTPEGHFLKKLL